ncbi:MAG: bifunctional DNA primase/polymerase [Desulfurellales bacterium]|nr:MAG: bifunctional DNA primase/polymerase [Desulfurellales bacterium]
MSAIEKNDQGSPFSRAAPGLIALGYHVVPIIPPGASHPAAGKAPGKFVAGEWRGLGEWERFRDRAPTDFELNTWLANHPDANIGIVCGSPAGDGLGVMAVDIDTNDFEEIDILLGALPPAIMSKKGAKGQTLFYRAPPEIKSKSYDLGVRPHARRVVDLLTGSQTRQTVAPPSNHASGAVYRWLSGPAPAHDLTVFDDAALEKLEDTLGSLGWNPDAQRQTRAVNPSRSPLDPDDIWSETKAAALVRLADWLPALGLYNLRRARAGFEAVATWRESSTGRPLDERKRNLSIQPTGIKDFGTGETFSALDLVMRARGCDLEAATIWLRARLGFDDTPIMVVAPVTAPLVETMDPETGEVLIFPIAASAARPAVIPPAKSGFEEMPKRLLAVTGLLHRTMEWIVETSTQPQAGFALGASLAIMAGASGQRYGGPTGFNTHIYILAIGKSSSGKDRPLKAIPQALIAAGLEERVGIDSFTTVRAIYDQLVDSPVSVAHFDEVGDYFEQVRAKNAIGQTRLITSLLKKSFEAKYEAFPTQRNAYGVGVKRLPKLIYSPSLSFYGTSTPSAFHNSMRSDDVAGGFLNRCLFISTDLRPPKNIFEGDTSPPRDVVSGLRTIAGTTAQDNGMQTSTQRNACMAPLFRVDWSDKAKDMYKEFDHYISMRIDRDERLGDVFGRTSAIALRLATLKAIGDRHTSPRIEVADMAWATDFTMWSSEGLAHSVTNHISDSQSEADVKFILRVVRERGRIPHNELVQIVQKVRTQDRDAAIKVLFESERIDIVTEATGGRPRKSYVYLKD